MDLFLLLASLPFLWIALGWPLALVYVRSKERVGAAAIEKWTFPGLVTVSPPSKVPAWEILAVWTFFPVSEIPLFFIFGDGPVGWYPGGPISMLADYRSDASTEETLQRFLAIHERETGEYRTMRDDLCPVLAAERGLAPDVCQPSFNMTLPGKPGSSEVFMMIERKLATPHHGLVGSTEVQYEGGRVITAVQFSYIEGRM